ncbi:MAG: hypothetical protein ACQEXC_00430 [Pseudomonadota bacterium]
MRFGFINDFETQVGVELSPGQTSLTITAGGAEFADASTDKQYVLTLVERDIRGVDLRREVVYAAGRSDNTLTVIRAREGTAEQTWPVGSPVECRVSAASLENMAVADDIAQALSDHEAAADPHPGYATDQDLVDHEAAADPHPQYQRAITGLTYAQQVSITGAALDLTDGAAESIVTVPSGHRLYLDSLDLVVASADTVSGAPEVQAGPDSGGPAAYLAASAVTGQAAGERDVFPPLETAGVTTVRFSVATAGTATAWTVTPVIRGYLLEM